MRMKVLWREWIAQPPEHRALYLAVTSIRNRMRVVEDREADNGR